MKLEYYFNKATNEVFIPVKASGINIMFLLVDGIRLMTFSKRKNPFVGLNDVIKWYEKELPYSKDKEFKEKVIKQMKDKNDELLNKHKGEIK